MEIPTGFYAPCFKAEDTAKLADLAAEEVSATDNLVNEEAKPCNLLTEWIIQLNQDQFRFLAKSWKDTNIIGRRYNLKARPKLFDTSLCFHKVHGTKKMVKSSWLSKGKSSINQRNET